MEISELPDRAQEALLNFVRALARRQARIDFIEESRRHQLVPTPSLIRPDEKQMAADAENGSKVSEALTPRSVVANVTAAPDFMTPEQFAKHYGWSPRRVRQIAREIGACRIIGNRMLLLDEDVRAILEAIKPVATKPVATKNNLTAIPQGGFAELVEFRKQQAREELERRAAKAAERRYRRPSGRKSKPPCAKVSH